MDFQRKSPRILNGNAAPADSSPGESAPGELAADGKPPSRRRRPLVRFLTRAAVVLALLFASFVLALFLIPFNMPLLNARLANEFRNATGLELQSEGATVRLRDSEVVIENPSVRDPGMPGPPLAMRSVTIEISFLQFLTDNPPYRIDSIELEGPFSVDLKSQDGQITLGEPYVSLLATLRSRLGQTSQTQQRAQIGIGRIGVHPVELNLTLQRATGEQGSVKLQNARVEVGFEGSTYPKIIYIYGVFNGRPDRLGGEPGFQLSLRPGQQGAFSGSLRLADFDSDRDLPYPVPVSFAARGVDLQIESALTSTTLRSVHSSARLAGLTLRDPDSQLPNELSDVRLEAAGQIDLTARQLSIAPFRVESRDLGTTITGSIGLDWPHDYALHVEPLDLRGSGLMILAEQFKQAEKVEGSTEAHVTLTAAVAGDFAERHPRSVLGTLELSGINWTQEALPMPLLGLEASARLTTTGLELNSASASVNGVPLTIKGRVRGDVLRRRIEGISLEWETRGEIQDMASIARGLDIPQAEALVCGGRLRASGSVALRDPFEGTLAQALGRARFSGEVRFRDASVAHPALPAPLEALNGALQFDSGEARFVGLVGKMGGLSLELEGKVNGKPQFWRDPVLDLQPRLQGSAIDLARVVRAARHLDSGASVTLPVLGGSVDARLHVTLSPREWRRMKFAGSIALNDVATSISTRFVNGPAVVHRLDFNCTTQTLTIDHLEGTLGEIAFDLGARLSPSQAELTLKAEGDLAEVKQRIPLSLRFFRAAGPAKIDHRTTLRPRPGTSPPEDWGDWVELLLDPTRRPAHGLDWWHWIQDEWELKNAGTLELNDAELTWITMPTALDHASGMARYDDTHLWTPEPLTLRAGEGSSQVNGTLELRYDLAREPLQFSFDIKKGHFNLGAWLKPWHFPEGFWAEGEHREDDWPDDAIFDPALRPFFILKGKIATDTAEAYDIHGSQFEGNLDLKTYHGAQPTQLVWSETRARTYDGDMQSSGTLFNGKLRVHAEGKDVNIGPLWNDFKKRTTGDSKFSGQLSATLDGNYHFGLEPRVPFAAAGEMTVVKSRFVSSKILNSLGGLLKLPLFEDISFSTIRGPYRMEDTVFIAEGITFDNPFVNMRATGNVGPAGKLDLVLRIEFLQIADRVPLLSNALDMFNKLAGKLLQVRVTGTADAPEVKLL